MAVTTKVDWATLIPSMWADSILRQLRANIIVARLVKHDFENEVKKLGDTVKINKVGALTAADKVAGTSVTRQTTTATGQDLVLNKHKVVPFSIEDVARGQANPKAMDEQMLEAGRALAEQYESDVLAAIVAAAAGGNIMGAAGAAADEALVLGSRKAFADNKVPQAAMKAAIWGTKDNNALLTTSSSKFTNANTRGDAGSALREGHVGRLYGIEHFESQLINVVAGAPATVQNVGLVPEAVQVAVRPMESPPEGVGAKGSVTFDEESGLAVRVVMQYDIDAMALACNCDVLYGIKVTRPEWVQLLRG